MNRWIYRSFNICLAFLFLCSFRITYKGNWNISRDEPTIWIKLNDEVYSSKFSGSGFPAESDPLADVPEEFQVQTVIQMIMDEINSIEKSFLRLAWYPVDLDEHEDDPLDTPFSEDNIKNRVITIAINDAVQWGTSTGRAEIKTSGNKFTSCLLSVSPTQLKSGLVFKWIFGHELGHCLGLMHHHSDRDCYMSYHAHSRLSGMGVNEIQALIYQYPTEDEFAEEEATLGLACEAKPQ